MTLYHVAVFFNPTSYFVLRAIGRISFPIFLFLLVEGFYHTHNRVHYFLRLLFFSFFCEVIYDFCFHNSLFYPFNQNIFFTLTICFLLLSVFSLLSNRILSLQLDMISKYIIFISLVLLIICLFIIFSITFSFSYPVISILWSSIFYFFHDKKIFLFLSFIVITLFFSTSLQLFSVFAILFLLLYNGKRGRKIKFLFYFYYPVHLLILHFLSL